MSAIYLERRDALERRLAEYLPELRWTSPQAGLHAVLALGARHDDVAITRAAGLHGVSVTPLSPHYINRSRASGLVLGFGIPSPGEIRIGVRTLRDTLHALRR